MRDPGHRTKVVLRRLPPAIPQQAVMEQIDARFAGRYDWACFRPGSASQKNHRYSRLYLNFKRPEDVVEFAEFFNGHVFVNEKGAQFKAIVEYAPSQQVPKSYAKKDGREGTIIKDPEYLEFLELIGKPVEHLPSAEIQLERKEAERAAAGKEAPVVTPLMVYVRQQRAAKSMAQRSGSGRVSRKVTGILTNSSSSSRRGSSEKRRITNSTYVMRENAKDGNFKEKPTYLLVPRRDEQTSRDKATAGATSTDASSGGTSGPSQAFEARKDKIVLLKGRTRVDSNLSDGATQQSVAPMKHMSPSASRQEQRLEASGRVVKTILSNKEARHLFSSHPEQEAQITNPEKDKRPPRAPNLRSILKDQIGDSADKGRFDEKHSHLQGSVSERIDRHARNRDRPDRGVWAPRHSDRSPSGGRVQNSSSDPLLFQSHSVENFSQQVDGHGERKTEARLHGGIRSSAVENGSHRHVNRRGPSRGMKDIESSLSTSDGKPPKRGSTGYGAHERQVWVQKSGSGS